MAGNLLMNRIKGTLRRVHNVRNYQKKEKIVTLPILTYLYVVVLNI